MENLPYELLEYLGKFLQIPELNEMSLINEKFSRVFSQEKLWINAYGKSITYEGLELFPEFLINSCKL